MTIALTTTLSLAETAAPVARTKADSMETLSFVAALSSALSAFYMLYTCIAG